MRGWGNTRVHLSKQRKRGLLWHASEMALGDIGGVSSYLFCSSLQVLKTFSYLFTFLDAATYFFAFLYFFTSVHISSHVSPTMTLTLLLCHLLVLPLATSRGTLTSGQVRLSASLRNLTKRRVDEPSG